MDYNSWFKSLVRFVNISFIFKLVVKYSIIPCAIFLTWYFRGILPSATNTFVSVMHYLILFGVFGAGLGCITMIVSLVDLVGIYVYQRKGCNIVYKLAKETKMPEKLPKVVILYPTRNDFMEEPCLSGINQDYGNCELFILDDSNDEKIKKQIDEFGKKYNVNVIRRTTNTGYKAGNINNFLKNYDDWDYYMVMDADVIVSKQYVSANMPLFYAGIPNLGLIQGVSSAYKTNSVFSNVVGERVNFIASQYLWFNAWSSKHISHSDYCAIIKKELYREIEGIEEVVNSDSALIWAMLTKTNYCSVDTTLGTYSTMEPLNFRTFYSREKRWVQAEVDLIKKCGVFSPLHAKRKFQEKMGFWKWMGWGGLLKQVSNYVMGIVLLVISPFFMITLNVRPFNYLLILMMISGGMAAMLIILHFIVMIYETGSVKRAIRISVGLYIYLIIVSVFYKFWIISKLLRGKKTTYYVSDKFWKELSWKETLKFSKKFIIMFLINSSVLVTLICVQFLVKFNKNEMTFVWLIIGVGFSTLNSFIFLIISLNQNKQDNKAVYFEYSPIWKYKKLKEKYGYPTYPRQIRMDGSNVFYDAPDTIKPQVNKSVL